MIPLPAADTSRRRRFRSADAAELRYMLETGAAVVFGAQIADVFARTRGPAHVAFARQCAMYVARRVGLSYDDIGILFGRDRTTARHACRLVARRRGAPGLALRLELFEFICTGKARRGARARVLQ